MHDPSRTSTRLQRTNFRQLQRTMAVAQVPLLGHATQNAPPPLGLRPASKREGRLRKADRRLPTELRTLMKRPPIGVVLIAVALGMTACASSHHGMSVSPMPGTVPSTHADVAIARVQAAEAGLRFFPNGQTSVGCSIPGPVGQGVKGTCRTTVSYTPGARTPVVTFTESWSARRFRTGGSPHRTLHHSWRFEVRSRGIVPVGTGAIFRLRRPTSLDR